MTVLALTLLLALPLDDATALLNAGHYREAITAFDAWLRVHPNDPDALEGRGKAFYWSGDWRRAVRDFRRVPEREYARQALRDLALVTRPSQRFAIDALHDDQPLDVMRGETSATWFSDPLTRWTVVAAASHFDADRRGSDDKPSVRIDNETRFGNITIAASLGAFDGRAIGGVSARVREWTLAIDRREEVAAATALAKHATSTAATLRWTRETETFVAAAEASERRYFDDNDGHAFVAYAVARRKIAQYSLWYGGSIAARDTRDTRFVPTAVSSSFDPQGFFRYDFRGEYDPYWTPDDLREARGVLAVERTFARGSVKLYGDGGVARDRGRTFGPNAGLAPLPQRVETYAFDRDSRPYRFGITASMAIAGAVQFEIGFERGATVDYRSHSFHAALVRRR